MSWFKYMYFLSRLMTINTNLLCASYLLNLLERFFFKILHSMFIDCFPVLIYHNYKVSMRARVS